MVTFGKKTKAKNAFIISAAVSKMDIIHYVNN